MIVSQLGECLSQIEEQLVADEKALTDCIGEAASARKNRWAKFEEDFDLLVRVLREVRACCAHPWRMCAIVVIIGAARTQSVPCITGGGYTRRIFSCFAKGAPLLLSRTLPAF